MVRLSLSPRFEVGDKARCSTMQEFVGKVTTRMFGKGSKSEHEAVYLDTEQALFVLRRQSGNPFHDAELFKLVGKTIRCQGEASGRTLIMASWKVVDS